jgi:hypothetical protein
LVCDFVCALAMNFRQTTMPPDAVGLTVIGANLFCCNIISSLV